MKKKFAFIFSIVLGSLVAGCSYVPVTPTVPSDPETPENPGTEDPGTEDPTDPETPETPTDPEDPETPETPTDPEDPSVPGNSDYLTYSDFVQYNYGEFLTNKGDVNVLVVPVQFTNSISYSDSSLERFDEAFNGLNEDGTTNYWESVSSYYRKQSYGLLNINFDITDSFTSSLTPSQFVARDLSTNYSVSGAEHVLNELRDELTIGGVSVDYTKYDNDNDGYVDAIWLIYCEEYEYNWTYEDYEFWAYVSWLDNNPNVNDPTFQVYANASYAFLHDDNTDGHDTHTMIHETGHLLGLDDYYSYDDDDYSSASGGLQMMNLNIGSQDSFSRYALGWIDPVVASSTGVYSIKKLEEEGTALIIPSKNAYYGNAFGEYLIIEYYSPTGVNALDASRSYQGYPRMYTEEGFVIYHVDARLAGYTSPYGRGTFIDSTSDLSSYRGGVLVAACNSDDYSPSGYNLLTLLGKDGRQYENQTTSVYANNDSLYKVGDTFYSTSCSYLSSGRFNNGETLDVTIRFNSITDGEASISVIYN